MAEDRLRERAAIGIIAFLMIMCGIGIAVCLAVGFGAYLGDISLGVYNVTWVHGFTIMIPGMTGIFVACACGCCNTRCAYITNAVFDSVGLVSLLGGIINLWSLDHLFILVGSTGCTEDCDLYKIMYDCGVALACMWTFGAILTIVHLVLVCHMAYALRDTTPGQIVYMPAQAPMDMQSYPNQGYAVQSSQPQQDYPTKSGY